MGFTLIELLVTIAIIGVLAGVVLIAIDPAQQVARARDAGVKSELSQIAGAIEAYAVAHNGAYITGVTTAPASPGVLSAPNEGCAGSIGCPSGIATDRLWDEVLVSSGEIKSVRTKGMVYDSDNTGSRFRIYALMSSTKLEGEQGMADTVNSSSCSPSTYTYGAGAEVYYVYDSVIAQPYWWCTSAGPVWPRPSL